MTPTLQDLAYLRSNPSSAAKFDTQFGAGTADRALTPPPANVTSGEPKQRDFDYLRANPGVAGSLTHGSGKVPQRVTCHKSPQRPRRSPRPPPPQPPLPPQHSPGTASTA